ncbi:MAG: alpha/beta fold hydrolase [Kutzneria sp.]|nr:alpha/beta fold hydrolase [Kutzneria sp.]
MRSPLPVTAVFATALMAAAMVAIGGSAAATPTGGSVAEPRPAAADKLFTHACAGHPGYECGTLQVPLDYAAPAGQKLDIAVTRMKASGTAEQRQGVILFNPGGPGGSGLYWASSLPESVRKAYDFIGFDPRGVGESSPIHCVDGAKFFAQPSRDTNPVTDADKEPFKARAEQYAQGCVERSGLELPFVTTPNTARDMDEIRQALGEPRINYFGVSYGTYLGVVYGQLFPGQVRRMLIDSSVNADRAGIWYQDNLDQDIAFQRRAEQWFEWIAKYDQVFHLGTSKTAVYASYTKARTQLKAKAEGVVGPDELDSMVVNSGYYDIGWVANATALSDYLVKGDATKLNSFTKNAAATSAESENSNAVYTAVGCNDAHWPRDFSTWDRDNIAYAAKAPIETWSNAWMNLPCAYWKVPQQDPLVIDGHGLPPIMMLQGTMDAATPFEGAVRTHGLLPSSRMIIEEGGGSHGLYNEPWVGNSCLDGYATDYLLTGAVPVKDVVCPAHPQPVPTAATVRSQPAPAARKTAP